MAMIHLDPSLPPPDGRCCILELPAEVRVQIYNYILPFQWFCATGVLYRKYEWADDGDEEEIDDQVMRTPSILRTCKQIHAEALPVLYGNTGVVIDEECALYGQHRGYCDPDEEEGLNVVPGMAYIRHFHLAAEIAGYCPNVPKLVKLLVPMLAACSTIKTLRITLRNEYWDDHTARCMERSLAWNLRMICEVEDAMTAFDIMCNTLVAALPLVGKDISTVELAGHFCDYMHERTSLQLLARAIHA